MARAHPSPTQDRWMEADAASKLRIHHALTEQKGRVVTESACQREPVVLLTQCSVLSPLVNTTVYKVINLLIYYQVSAHAQLCRSLQEVKRHCATFYTLSVHVLGRGRTMWMSSLTQMYTFSSAIYSVICILFCAFIYSKLYDMNGNLCKKQALCVTPQKVKYVYSHSFTITVIQSLKF